MTEHEKVHTLVLGLIRQWAAANPDRNEIAESSDRELLRKSFGNYRSGYGIRLTSFALKIIKRSFETFEIPIDNFLTAREIVMLDRASTMPYYVKETRSKTPPFVFLTLFDRRMAALIKMNSAISDALEGY